MVDLPLIVFDGNEMLLGLKTMEPTFARINVADQLIARHGAVAGAG
jgi:hypothetical protein